MDSQVESHREAIVTHVHANHMNLLQVWAQLSANDAEEIERAMLSCETIYRDGSHKVSGVEELMSGALFSAKFEDGKWYRAKIINVSQLARGVVKAFFVDYGNEDDVSVDDIRRMDVKLASFPHQAQGFILANVVPVGSKWSEAALKFCNDRIVNEDVRLTFGGSMQGIPLVNIFCSDTQASLPFAVELVREGHARQPVDNAALVPFPNPSIKMNAMLYSTDNLDFGEGQLFLMHVESTIQFWIQSRKSQDKYNWKGMASSLETACRGYQVGVNNITQGMIDQPCIARNDCKGCYARGLIKSLDGRVACKVFFVDYGNVEVKMIDRVYHMLEGYMGIPVMAHCATLALEFCSTDVEQLILSLTSMVEPVPIYGKILGRDDHGKYRLEMHEQQNQGLQASNHGLIPLTYETLTIELGTVYNAIISHVVSAAEFYIRLEENRTNYELKCSEMQFLFGQVAPAPVDEKLISPGLACCTKSLRDGRWYRAIVKFMMPSGVQVYFVDIGKYETVPVKQVLEIPHPVVLKMPAQAIRCKLGGLTSQDVQAPRLVKELCAYESISLKLIALNKDENTGAYVVNLETHGVTPASINERVFALAQAETNPKVFPRQLDRVESLFIIVFESVHCFFGQLEKVSQKELDVLQASINRFYGELTTSEMVLKVEGDYVGTFCCAPYAVDGSYYRARIIKKLENCVDVLFIDFGNEQTVLLCEIKRLLPEFAAVPSFGITCHIADPMRVAASSEAIGEALAGKSVWLEILDQDENHSFAVRFRESPTDLALNKTLISTGLISPPTPTLLEYRCLTLEDEELVVITHFKSPLHFWIQNQQNTPILKKIAAQIELFLSNEWHAKMINNPKEGMPCLALNDDSIWYRAVVKAVLTKSEVCIQFVDYGDSCTLPLSDLRAIPEELMEFPCQAAECCFADVRPVEFTRKVLKDVEMQLLNVQFPVRVLSHEFPIKLEFTLDMHKEILWNNDVLKTHPSNYDHPSSLPQASTENMNSFPVNGELNNSGWDDSYSAQSEVLPIQHASPHDPNPPSDWKEECTNEDFNSSFQRGSYRSGDSRGSQGNPRDGTRRSRWDPPPDEWGSEPRHGHWSESRNGEDRKPGNRGAGHRFIPPRMQRQMDQEGFDKSGSGFSSKVFYKSDSRADNHPASHMVNGGQKYSEPMKQRSNGCNGSSAFSESPKLKLSQQPNLSGQFKQVTVVHAISPSELYCQLTEQSVAMRDLLEKLNAHYTGLGPGECGLSEFSVGVDCCVRFARDMRWYRARVVRLSGLNAVVSFIDYGNEETVELVHLKILLPEFLGMPAQALKCCLESVKPVGATWEARDCELLVAVTKNKQFLCQFLDKTGDAFPVKLIDQEQMSYAAISYDLLARGQALPINPGSSFFKEIAAGHVQSSFAESHMELGSVENVTVVWVNDPSQFFCQLEINANKLQDLDKRLRSVYSSNDNSKLAFQAPPAPNTPCAALLCSVWYRGVALTTVSNNAVVYFVDYGNVEVVAMQDIKVMMTEFMELPAQVYKCNLRGIKPFGKYWPKMDATKFQKYFEGSLICTFCNKYSQGFEVDLILNGKDVAREMIADRFACVDGTTILPETPVRSLCSLVGLEDAPTFVPLSFKNVGQDNAPVWKMFNYKFNERVEVLFSFVISPDQFYLQNAVDEPRINSLLDALRTEYLNSQPEDLGDIVVGSLCVAQYSEDDDWYRAVVLGILDEGYCVRFIDFGNEEMILPDKMRKIAPKFVDFPQFAAECKLHGFHVPSDGPTPDTIYEAFNGLIQEGEKRVMAEFKSKVGDKFQVVLYDQDTELTTELLVALGLPLSQALDVPSTFLSQTFAVGDSVEVFVSHIDSLSEFWVQRVCDEDSINKLQNELKALCGDGTEPHGDVTIGAPCLAQYTEDENWNRALVLAITEQGVQVQFVDYGNCDVVQPDKVMKITENFFELPRLAVKCVLNGLENCSQEVCNSQEMVDAFFEATGYGALTLSANVVGQVNDAFLVQLLSESVDVMETLNLPLSGQGPASFKAAGDDFELLEDKPKIVTNVLGMAQPSNESESSIETELSVYKQEDSHIETEMVSNDIYALAELAYKVPEIPFDVKIEVYLSSIISPSLFWIQLDSKSVELTEMAAHLDEAFNDSTADEAFELTKGVPCIAQYSADDSWYRASVLEVLPDRMISVLFVDYGNVEVVPFDKVRRMTEEFQDVPVFAHRCRLTRLKVPDSGAWNEDVNETFKELLNFGEVLCLAEFLKIEKGVYVVRLLNMGVDVTDSLVETGKVEASASPLQFVEENVSETVYTEDTPEDNVKNTSQTTNEDANAQQDTPKEFVDYEQQSLEEKIMSGDCTDVELRFSAVEVTCNRDGDDSPGKTEDLQNTAEDTRGSEIREEFEVESRDEEEFWAEEEPRAEESRVDLESVRAEEKSTWGEEESRVDMESTLDEDESRVNLQSTRTEEESTCAEEEPWAEESRVDLESVRAEEKSTWGEEELGFDVESILDEDESGVNLQSTRTEEESTQAEEKSTCAEAEPRAEESRVDLESVRAEEKSTLGEIESRVGEELTQEEEESRINVQSTQDEEESWVDEELTQTEEESTKAEEKSTRDEDESSVNVESIQAEEKWTQDEEESWVDEESTQTEEVTTQVEEKAPEDEKKSRVDEESTQTDEELIQAVKKSTKDEEESRAETESTQNKEESRVDVESTRTEKESILAEEKFTRVEENPENSATDKFELDSEPIVEFEKKEMASLSECNTQSDHVVQFETHRQPLDARQNIVDGEGNTELTTIEKTLGLIEETPDTIMDTSKVDEAHDTFAAGEQGATGGQMVQSAQTSVVELNYIDQDSGVGEIFEDSRSETEDQVTCWDELRQNKSEERDVVPISEFSASESEEIKPNLPKSPAEVDEVVAITNAVEDDCQSKQKAAEVLDVTDTHESQLEHDGEFWMNGAPEEMVITFENVDELYPHSETSSGSPDDDRQSSIDLNVSEHNYCTGLADVNKMSTTTEKHESHSDNVGCPSETRHEEQQSQVAIEEDYEEKCDPSSREPVTEDRLQSLDRDLEMDKSLPVSDNESFLDEGEEVALSTALTTTPKQSSPKSDSCVLEDFIPATSGQAHELLDSKHIQSCSPIHDYVTKEDASVSGSRAISTATESESSVALDQCSLEVLQSQESESQDEGSGTAPSSEAKLGTDLNSEATVIP